MTPINDYPLPSLAPQSVLLENRYWVFSCRVGSRGLQNWPILQWYTIHHPLGFSNTQKYINVNENLFGSIFVIEHGQVTHQFDSYENWEFFTNLILQLPSRETLFLFCLIGFQIWKILLVDEKGRFFFSKTESLLASCSIYFEYVSVCFV